MKIKFTEEVTILVDDVYETKRYIHIGEEFEVYPTDDGMKFKVCDKELSPYDFSNSAIIVDK